MKFDKLTEAYLKVVNEEATPTGPFKLYVWEDVFTDYTSGLAFGIGRSKEEAAHAAAKNLNTEEVDSYDIEEGKVKTLLDSPHKEFSLNAPIGAYVYGGG